MKIAEFIKYSNNYFIFSFENGIDISFEEIHPKALVKYDLKNDDLFVGKLFNLEYSESRNSKEYDINIYRIDYLELIDVN